MADYELHHFNVQMLLKDYGDFLQKIGYDIHGSDNKLRNYGDTLRIPHQVHVILHLPALTHGSPRRPRPPPITSPRAATTA